ncbi:Transposase [Bacteroidales bacterium Barb4]|nr:Transposase [Bacteroidales bacterium Barb4]
MLVFKGCIITIDAVRCQKEITRNIMNNSPVLFLALKSNQGTYKKW